MAGFKVGDKVMLKGRAFLGEEAIVVGIRTTYRKVVGEGICLRDTSETSFRELALQYKEIITYAYESVYEERDISYLDRVFEK